jgi:hypothetical protein
MGPAQPVTYANPLGEWLAPILLTLRAGGAFEASVYIPAMTIASVLLYAALHSRLRASRSPALYEHRWLWVPGYYAVCFLLTNSLAVGAKTLILEEIDYQEPVWLTRLVSPLHFYIASVAASYLWLITRGRRGPFDRALAYYVQTGLVGGYAVALYRIVFERFTLSDPTMAIGGFILGTMFAAYNVDLRRRICLTASTTKPRRAP